MHVKAATNVPSRLKLGHNNRSRPTSTAITHARSLKKGGGMVAVQCLQDSCGDYGQVSRAMRADERDRKVKICRNNFMS